jgi:hypothetical protein
MKMDTNHIWEKSVAVDIDNVSPKHSAYQLPFLQYNYKHK